MRFVIKETTKHTAQATKRMDRHRSVFPVFIIRKKRVLMKTKVIRKALKAKGSPGKPPPDKRTKVMMIMGEQRRNVFKDPRPWVSGIGFFVTGSMMCINLL
jgi:hypothetical protein